MPDYISALNGEQMDSALMDVALHNSEAWAVGTRNTIPVSSADETYHNNAKYYAQVAQSAIPGTYTAAVRWDIAQGLAGEAQEQARANISAGASNRNLLDNPWWGSGEVVNQRGVTAQPSSNGQYTIDRWTYTSGASANTMSIGANGITFTISSSSIWFAQPMANLSALNGRALTASVLFSDGTVKSGTKTFTNGTQATFIADGTNSLYISSTGIFNFATSVTQTVRAVKLEVGTYSTLANDTPPDYISELHKCMRYFIRVKGDPIGSGYVSAGLTTAYVLIPTPVPMRATPSWSINGSIYVRGTNGTWNSSTISVLTNQPPNGINITVPVSASQVMAVGVYPSSTNSYIDFSADL